MDKETLQKHLQALASGKETANAPIVEAYLADEQAKKVASLLERAASSHYLSKTPLFPPSSCLPLLD